MDVHIGLRAAPAMGDIRALGSAHTIWIAPEARSRADWARYMDAIMVALTRGADIRWETP